MSKSLKYGYDIETGSIAIFSNKSAYSTDSKKLSSKTKTKSKKKRWSLNTFKPQNEINKLEDSFDKHFIIQNFTYLKIELLKMARDNIIDKTKLKELDGLSLSTFIIYKTMYNSNIINLELIRSFKKYVTNLCNYSHLILQKIFFNKIIGYIDLYFNIF